MINHVRTLLLNSPALDGADACLGEEYVPAEFRPRRIPSELAGLYSAIRGVDPDREGLNFRLAQLAPLWHSSALALITQSADPRITYWPGARGQTFLGDATQAQLFTPFNRLAGPTTAPAVHRLRVFGRRITQSAGMPQACRAPILPPVTTLNQLRQLWDLTASSPTTITVVQRTGAQISQEITVSWTHGLSQPVLLPGVTQAYVQFQGDGFVSGGTWQIETLTQPAESLVDLARRVTLTLTPTALAYLLPARVPFIQLREYALNTTNPIQQLGAISLLLAFHLGEANPS